MFLESRQLPPLISVTQVHNSVRSKFESNLVYIEKIFVSWWKFILATDDLLAC